MRAATSKKTQGGGLVELASLRDAQSRETGKLFLNTLRKERIALNGRNNLAALDQNACQKQADEREDAPFKNLDPLGF
jgi:hypothetical protein